MKHKLSRPYKYEGMEFTELEVNLENLTTADYEKAEREFKALNHKASNQQANGTMIEMETGFVKIVLCKAIGKTHDFLDNLPIADFAKLKVVTQGFLLTGNLGLLDNFVEHA